MQKVADPEVWKALNDALQPYQASSSGIKSEYKWFCLLRVAEGNAAQLTFPPDNPDMVRIAITKAETNTSYDIQLNQPRLKVKPNSRYVVNFMARADRVRNIGFGIAKGDAPWTNLGLYREIELTSEWQSFEENFIVTENENNARIHFDVGGSDISVELSSVTLRSLSEGNFVKPDLPSMRSGQPVPDNLISEPPVEFGEVQFGSLRRVTPISQDFGGHRGRPIDRYYIENFLECCLEDVQGRVLEVGDNTYTRRFGGERVIVSDVLHVAEGGPQATIIADLATADHIPSNSFDCIILTQTLQLIYDVRAALKTIYRILKPSGVLLATFPGISQTYDREWGDSWYWNFTNLSARRLFEEIFPAASLKVEAFGNVLAAISFLHGLAVEELSPEELDHREPGYDVTITVRAIKPEKAYPVSAVNKLPQAALRLTSSLNAKVLILIYHRVASALSDPWSLCVSPRRFAQQLEFLRKYTQIMRLQELTEVFDKAAILQPSVVVTFDDGYANNFHNARPLLERHGVPATIFIASGYLGTEHEFWWDELERLLLQPGTLPERLQLSIDGINHQWELAEGADYSERLSHRHHLWRAWEEPPTFRHSIYFSLWQRLQRLREEERQSVLGELRAWANVAPACRETHRPLSVEELSDLAKEDLIEIGCHTVTHSALSTLPVAAQRVEIQRSKKRLEQITGRTINSFAYPYGSRRDYTIDTVRLVKEAGFACACSTTPTVVIKDSNRFELPRLHVQDWDGDEFARRLSLWFDA